jgi:hypothetical protein
MDSGCVIAALGEDSCGRSDDLLELFLWLSAGLSPMVWES